MRKATACLLVLLAACGDSDGGDIPISNPDDAGVVDTPDSEAPVEAGSDTQIADAGFAPPVACGTTLPGPALADGVTETQPGYAAELAALDLTTVPDPLDYSTSSAFVREVVNYMLERAAGTSVTHAEALAKGELGRAVLGAAAKGTGGKIDITFLRRGLYAFYSCSRPLPIDLDTFKARYGDYQTWSKTDIGCSAPKNGPRRIWKDDTLGIYVAETLVEAGVRETEILFTNLRGDGQIDFAPYTADGHLTDRSTFATGSGGTVTSSAPYTCMACHVDTASGTFSDLFPSGTGAGCK